MINFFPEEYESKLNEPDPAYVEFSIQDVENQYIITLFNPDTKEEYPGQCIVTHEGEIIFSDFSKDMTNTILGELDVPLF